jgi:DNA-binding SARP family transcriptional activator
MIFSSGTQTRLNLLDTFEVFDAGEPVRLPLPAQRLLAALALSGSGVHRATAAELLWPNSPRRAMPNLRTALWQARQVSPRPLIDSDGPRIRLSATVHVDHRAALEQARGVAAAQKGHDNDQELIWTFSRGLLPEWHDEWLLVDQERWNQIRLHALETLARQLIKSQFYLPALEAALAAVAIEPVRESAHRTVVEVYLAEGNTACALKHYHRYRGLVQRELGVMPSPQMTHLINAIPAR